MVHLNTYREDVPLSSAKNCYYEILRELVCNMCNIHPRKLQHTYSKHKQDFGFTANWNKQIATQFEQAIQNHIGHPASQQIKGTYRRTIPVTHYFDPATGLNVIVDANNDFVGGWRLSPAQIQHLLTSGNVQ